MTMKASPILAAMLVSLPPAQRDAEVRTAPIEDNLALNQQLGLVAR
jgi:hypothetical protein